VDASFTSQPSLEGEDRGPREDAGIESASTWSTISSPRATGSSFWSHRISFRFKSRNPRTNYNAGLLSAGTGLGETILVRVKGRFLPVPSETGHTDFAPRTDDELRVFRAFRARYGRVSWERVVSGLGLGALGEFFHEERGAMPTGSATSRKRARKVRPAS